MTIIRFTFMDRHPNMTREEFNEHWLNVHAPLAAKLPGLRAYNQHHIADDAPYGLKAATPGDFRTDGVAELHFADAAAMRAAFRNEIAAAALEDNRTFIGRMRTVIVERHQTIPRKAESETDIKRMVLLTAKPGVSREEFRREWLVEHARMVREWPRVLGYHQNIVTDRFQGFMAEPASHDDVPVDGIVEFWFRNMEEIGATYETDIVRETQEHGGKFLASITPFFIRTHKVI